MKKQFKILPLILALGFIGTSIELPAMRWLAAPIAHADTVSDTVALLRTITEQMDRVRSYVEKEDKHQFEAYIKTTEELTQAIQTDTLSPATQQQLSDFFEDFLYADAFFERITTVATRDEIARIKDAYTKILNRRKEDVKPYARIARLYRRVQSHLVELKGMASLTDAQRAQISALMAPIGTLVAKNEVTGDRPCMFAEARKVYNRVRDAYPTIEAIGAAPAAYWSTVYIHALNERFADYAQNNEIDELRCKDEAR